MRICGIQFLLHKLFLSNSGYSKVKLFLRATRKKKSKIKSFLSKKGYNKVKNIIRAAREKKGYNQKLSKQKEVQQSKQSSLRKGYNKKLSKKKKGIIK